MQGFETGKRWAWGGLALLAACAGSTSGSVKSVGFDKSPAVEGAWSPPSPTGRLDDRPLEWPPAFGAMKDPSTDRLHVRLTDASDRAGFGSAVYSQLQAFSPSETMVLVTGTTGYQVLHLKTGAALQVPGIDGWNAPRWDPAHPGAIIHYDSNADARVRIQRTDVLTMQVDTLLTLPAEVRTVHSGPSFEELSRDGRWLTGMVRGPDNDVLFAADVVAGKVTVWRSLESFYGPGGPCSPDPKYGRLAPDWVGTSPLGRYMVIQWVRDAGPKTKGACYGLEAYDLRTGQFAGRIAPTHHHGDLGLSSDGREVFYTQVLASPEDNNRPGLVAYALPIGATPRLLHTLEWGSAQHISAQGPPGLVLISGGGLPSKEASGPPSPLPLGVQAGRLALITDTGQLTDLGPSRSSACGYWVQPRASLSPSGRWAIYASDMALVTETVPCARLEMGQGDAWMVQLDSGSATSLQ